MKKAINEMLFLMSIEWPRVLKNAAKKKMGGRLDIYLWKQLIKSSLLENESRYVILYNQALPKVYTH